MSVTKLRDVRNFFVKHDNKIDEVADLTLKYMYATHPRIVPMRSDGLQQHRQLFSRILRRLIDLTRTCYLWPVSVQTGQATLPGLDDLRSDHEKAGVSIYHFEAMKSALLQALEETFPHDFSRDLRAAFSFVFDVLAKSLASVSERCENRELLRKFAVNAQDQEAADITLAHVMGYAGEMPEVLPHWADGGAAMALR